MSNNTTGQILALRPCRSGCDFSGRPDLLVWFGMFQAHPEEAPPSQHVRDLGKRTVSRFVFRDTLDVFAFPQEDDIDGEHIVAFAEEDDPGLFLFCLPSSSVRGGRLVLTSRPPELSLRRL